VTIRRAVEDVFTVPRRLREHPEVELRNCRDEEDLPWRGGRRDDVPTDPFHPGQTRGRLRGDRFRASQPLEVHGDIGPFIATISYLLTPIGDGTRLTNAVDLKPSSAVLRLFAPLAVSRVKASVAANLEKLKQVLETRDDPAMTSDEKVT
jgi:hypothetical protein